MEFGGASDLFHHDFPAEGLLHGGHFHTGQTAGVYPREWIHRSIHVKRNAMKTYPVADGYTDASNFLITDPYAPVLRVSPGLYSPIRCDADHYFL